MVEVRLRMGDLKVETRLVEVEESNLVEVLLLRVDHLLIKNKDLFSQLLSLQVLTMRKLK